MKYQVDIAGWILQRRPLHLPRKMNKECEKLELTSNWKAWNDLVKKSGTHKGL